MKMVSKGMPFWSIALLFGVTVKDSCLPSLWESIPNDTIASELCKAHYPGAGAWSAPGASIQKHLPVGQELNFLESFLLLIFGFWFWGLLLYFCSVFETGSLFQRRLSWNLLCTPGWPWMDRDWPASASCILGLKDMRPPDLFLDCYTSNECWPFVWRTHPCFRADKGLTGKFIPQRGRETVDKISKPNSLRRRSRATLRKKQVWSKCRNY